MGILTVANVAIQAAIDRSKNAWKQSEPEFRLVKMKCDQGRLYLQYESTSTHRERPALDLDR